MIDINSLIESCQKAADAISELQEIFTGMDRKDDKKYNFTNKEIEQLDIVYNIIMTKHEDLKCIIEEE